MYTSCVSVQGNDNYPIHRAITKDLVAVGMIQPGLIWSHQVFQESAKREPFYNDHSMKSQNDRTLDAPGRTPVKAKHEELVGKEDTGLRTTVDHGR